MNNPILAKITKQLNKTSSLGDRQQAIANRKAQAIPNRSVGMSEQRLSSLFQHQCEKVSASVAFCDNAPAMVGEITNIWQAHHTDEPLIISHDILLDKLPWSTQSRPSKHTKNTTDITCACSVAFAAIAQTGTLVMLSSGLQAMGQNFLPETHIVIVRQSTLVGTMEAVWQEIRKTNNIARSITMITGPSRTGDIEQKIQLGAHGPLRLHIIVATYL